MAVDIVASGRPDRDDEAQLRLRSGLKHCLLGALTAAGIPERDRWLRDQGDGALLVLPAADGKKIAGPFLSEFRRLVRQHNRRSEAATRMQVRVAAHIGEVDRDEWGFSGRTMIDLSRMLEAPAFRDFVADSHAEVAFIASDGLFNSVVSPASTIDEELNYVPLLVIVKETRTFAWACVPPLRPGRAVQMLFAAFPIVAVLATIVVVMANGVAAAPSRKAAASLREASARMWRRAGSGAQERSGRWRAACLP